MNLLQAAITMDVNKLSTTNLIILLASALLLIGIILVNGIRFKIGDKEFAVGGIFKYLSKKDEDILLREQLKKQTDEIDKEMDGDLHDLIESLDGKLQRILINKHCWFTLDKFIGLIKRELSQRVRINNLKEKLCEDSRESYIAKILSKVKNDYLLLQAKAKEAACRDLYTDFSEIEGDAVETIGVFFEGAKAILIKHMERKIALYEKTSGEFRIGDLRRSSCDAPVEKNRAYIGRLRNGQT